jgi:hypothetical protein
VIEIDEPSASPVTVPRHHLPSAVAVLLLNRRFGFLPETEPERRVSRFTVNLPSSSSPVSDPP